MGRWARPAPSAFELGVLDSLKKLGFKAITEYILPNNLLGKKRFDSYLPDENIIIETDGTQHFRVPNKYFSDKDILLETQAVDRLKNWAALHLGYRFFRIDYDSWQRDLAGVLAKFMEFVHSETRFAVTDREVYQYLVGPVDDKKADKSCPTVAGKRYLYFPPSSKPKHRKDQHINEVRDDNVNCCSIL